MRPVVLPSAPAGVDVRGQVRLTGPAGVEPMMVLSTDCGFMSEWELTPVERAAILAGANVRLFIVAPGHPVVAMTVAGCEE